MTLVRSSPSGRDINVGGSDVTSVFGRDGAVVAAPGDYSSTQVTNLSAVAGSTVTAALNALAAGASPVSSVFARTGAVVAASGDYTSTQVTNSSAVAGSTVTAALNALAALATGVLAYTEYLTGSGTHVFNAASRMRIIHIQAGGGGGGGVQGATGACRCAVGGQAGGWIEVTETGAPTGTGIYSIGAAGTAGVGGGASGGTGGNTSIGLNGGTQTAEGGIGGATRSSGGTLEGIDTPAPGPGVPNNAGDVGSVAFNQTASLGISGSGGSSLYGRGGFMFFATGTRPGQDGVGRGSGGSGASVVNSTATANGGLGVAGLIRIWEFG